MYKLILLIFALCASVCYGQNDRYVTFELSGVGGFASLNYEKSFFKKGVNDISYRFGFSVTPIDKNNGMVLIFPVMIHDVIGKTAHKLDLGIGQSFSVTTKGDFFILMPISFGYRYQPEDKKYYLRLAYTPLVSYLIDFQWQHWAGFTYGYRLNKRE